MIGRVIKHIICLAAITSLASCSVKEQRAGCPVYLNINFDSIISSGQYENTLLNVESQVPVCEEELRLRDWEVQGYEVAARRGPVHMAAAFDYQSYSWHADTLRIKEGAESSRLFTWSESAICTGDLYHTSVDLNKQYCLMNIIIVGLLPGEDYAFDLRIKANCNGLALYDKDPIEGDYTVVASHKNASGYEVVIPRQRENRIVLELLEKNPKHIYDEDDIVSIIDVGADMEARGYDWEKNNLDDINVVLDFTKMSASIEVVPWNKNNIDIVI